MRIFQSTSLKVVLCVLIALLVLGGLAAASGAIPLPWLAADEKAASKATDGPASKTAANLSVELVEGKPNTLFLPEDIRTALGIRKDGVDLIAVAKVPERM